MIKSKPLATKKASPAKKIAKRKPAPLAKKSVAAPAPPVPAPVAAAPGVATDKSKLVRDSFTMPKAEYDLLAELKKRLLQHSKSVKKSELLRAGIAALTAMSDAKLVAAVEVIPNLKTGRPKKDKTAKAPKKSV